MDRKVVSIDKIQTLESIANIAAFLTIETNSYIGLGMVVEAYINDPSADNFKIMYDNFVICRDRFSKFNNARQQQISRLIKNGNLQTVTHDETTSPKVEMINLDVIPEPRPIPNNVIQFSGNKDVDKK